LPNNRTMQCAVILCFALHAASAQAVEVAQKTYAISGTTGLDLYRSVSENGPNGGGHVAQTAFKLTWKRLFDERGGDCYLVRADPVLSITQTFPKPAGELSPDMRRRWDKFAVGMRQHEDGHVALIERMVAETQASLSSSVERNDRSCAKVKKLVSAKIDAGYQAHRERSRAFDRQELGQGGRMFLMLEDLVNER